jgi:hypothetical protein
LRDRYVDDFCLPFTNAHANKTLQIAVISFRPPLSRSNDENHANGAMSP